MELPREPWPWHPDFQEPVSPIRGNHIVTVPQEGAVLHQQQAQAGDSLVPVVSITVTANKYPSDIAKEALEKLEPIDQEYCNSHEFVQYLLLCEQKGFRIKGYDTKKGKIVSYPLSYNNRWGPIRRRELAAKLERLQYWFELQTDRPVTMITLTTRHGGKSISSAWFELNKSRDKLRKLIFKYFGAVDYFWVVEPHKSGYAHYHMAVFAAVDNYTRDTSKHVGWVRCKGREEEDIWDLMDGQGIEDKFRDLWDKKYKTGDHTYGLNFSQKKNDSKIKNLKNYLQKYLAKGFLLDTWSPGMLKFNAAMWDTGFRMYGASKNIREIMNLSDDKADQIVWLETKIQEPQTTPEGKEYESERVVWYRQYIPDWLDSDFWIQTHSKDLRIVDPSLYIFDWGRGPWFNQLEYAMGGKGQLREETVFKEINYRESNFKRRNRDVNPYDTWRPPTEEDFAAARSRYGYDENGLL